ncbi:MAG: hypothetical protein RLY31_2819 [Bacteroidota bacterium]
MKSRTRHYRTLAIITTCLVLTIGALDYSIPDRFSTQWSCLALAAYTVLSLLSYKLAAVSVKSKRVNAFTQSFLLLVLTRVLLTLLFLWLSHHYLPRKDGFLFVYLGIYLVMAIHETMVWSDSARSG